DDNPNLFRYTDEESNDNNNSTISQNINYAVSKLSSQEKSNLSDLDIIASTSLLEKNYKTCQVIVKYIQKLPDILWYLNYSKDFDYILDRLLNIEYFLNLRQHHNAYLSKKLECKKVLLENINENNSKVDINKARKNNNKVFGKQNSPEHLSYANVTAIFLLQTDSYVIAMFDNTLCIDQIIAIYE
ncbi:13302_t:CDS:2, partial [Funneliformis caledonium]